MSPGRTVFTALALTALLSCEPPLAPDDVAVQLILVSGGDQSGPVGEELPNPVVVRVN